MLQTKTFYLFVLQAEAELRQAQAEFDRQAEITKLLLEGISSTHVSIVLGMITRATIYFPKCDEALFCHLSIKILHTFGL